jgi:pSer/pThr/pTyr-binding forkhead associated (FHA) protein
LELVQGRAPSLVQVRGENFLIGRSRSSDLVLPDAVASAKHVRLRYGQGAWFIQDQDSSNGTFVNGQRIKAQRLKDGDQIRMGETTYVFHV